MSNKRHVEDGGRQHSMQIVNQIVVQQQKEEDGNDNDNDEEGENKNGKYEKMNTFNNNNNYKNSETKQNTNSFKYSRKPPNNGFFMTLIDATFGCIYRPISRKIEVNRRKTVYIDRITRLNLLIESMIHQTQVCTENMNNHSYQKKQLENNVRITLAKYKTENERIENKTEIKRALQAYFVAHAQKELAASNCLTSEQRLFNAQTTLDGVKHHQSTLLQMDIVGSLRFDEGETEKLNELLDNFDSEVRDFDCQMKKVQHTLAEKILEPTGEIDIDNELEKVLHCRDSFTKIESNNRYDDKNDNANSNNNNNNNNFTNKQKKTKEKSMPKEQPTAL